MGLRPAGLFVLVAVCAACLALAASVEPPALLFEFERYNKTYTGLITELAPMNKGGLTIRVSSPEHDLEILYNRLSLQPAPGGLHLAVLQTDFRGEGLLVAEIDTGLLPTKLEDRVTIVEQRKTIEAVVEIEQHSQGYQVTLRELPTHTEVAIESQLGDSLVSLCESLSFFLGSRAACEEIERLLEHPRLALPEPGTVFVIDGDYLTESERDRLGRYLGEAIPAASLSISPATGPKAPLS